MGYPEKRGSGKKIYYRGRYKKRDGSYGTLPEKYRTDKEAKKAADAEEIRIGTHSAVYADPRDGLKKFGPWAEEWMAAKRRAPRTDDRRWFLLEKLILPRWEDIAIVEITWFDVEAWADSSDYDHSTVRDALTLMSSILTGAMDKRLVDYNVVAGRRWKPAPRRGKPVNRRGKKTGGKHKVVPTAEQAVLISRRCRNDTERLMVICATWLGLRYGELCALHRDNCLLERRDRIAGQEVIRYVVCVDPEVGELSEYQPRIDGRVKGKTVLELAPPKSENSVREIDVPPFLVDLLRTYMEAWPHPYLFTTPSGRWWRRSNWSGEFRPLCDGRPKPAVPGWRRCADELMRRVAAGEVAPGERMPTLKEIGAEFGIAVGTAQRAVAHLRERGVLEVANGRGGGVTVAADAAERAELPDVVEAWDPILSGLELHGCRHANDTRQEEGGVSEVLRRESLGHARKKDMDGVYLHPTPEMRQRRLEVLEQWWWQALAVVDGVPSTPVQERPKRWENAFLSQNSPKNGKSIKGSREPAGEARVAVNRTAL